MANYTVTLKNPTASNLTYELTVQGVPASWVSVPFQTNVPAGATVTVPLTITSDAFANLADYTFSVTSRTSAGAFSIVEGDLVLQGQAVQPDPESHAVAIALTPSTATAGQGTAANYVARVTNAGSATETFHLALTGLPIGFTVTFSENDLAVPPGAGNFRDVPLTITPPANTPATTYPFTVIAASTSHPKVIDSAAGSVTVASQGVSVDITSSSGSPGDTLQLVVTNTGQATDTFDVALGGPAGLVSTLGTKVVTLAAGGSQQITIQIGNIDFATPGTLILTATAISRTNPAVLDTDDADVNIAGIKRMGAAFVPASKQLPAPGTASFLLNVNNSGNLEDAYSATIVGATGPVTASLVGLDNQPTQAIDTFRLPGLSSGVILLNAALSALGQATVHVQIRSLTTGSIVADATATIVTPQADLAVIQTVSPNPVPPDGNLTFSLVISNGGPADALDVMLSDAIPSGTTFVSATQVSGSAFVLSTPPLGGGGSFLANSATLAAGASATFQLVVNVSNTTAAGTVISNLATISSTTSDSNPANNSASATADVQSGARLTCEVSTLNAPSAPGTAAIVADADAPGQNVLIVTGASGNDVLIIEPRPQDLLQVRVKSTGKLLGIFSNSSFQHIVVFGLAGNDTIIVDARISQPATLLGNGGNDSLYGGMGNDALDSGAGNDHLCGGDGNDYVYGQNGNDVVGGDAGSDHLYGEAGDDLVLGANGNDFLYGGSGNDLLFGQAGNDQLFGDSGDDIDVGGDGNDKLYGSTGRDLLIGGNGADQLFGEANDDILVAGATKHDGNTLALDALLAEWTSNKSYLTGVNNLRSGGGANDAITLDHSAILDDGLADLLCGDGGSDWHLLGRRSKIKDLARTELVN